MTINFIANHKDFGITIVFGVAYVEIRFLYFIYIARVAYTLLDFTLTLNDSFIPFIHSV